MRKPTPVESPSHRHFASVPVRGGAGKKENDCIVVVAEEVRCDITLMGGMEWT